MAETKKTTVNKRASSKSKVQKEVTNAVAAQEEQKIEVPCKQEEVVSEPIEIKVHKRGSILFVASECNPFVASGGLADVIGSLPKALAKNGNYDVRVVIPLYKCIGEEYRQRFTYLGNFNVGLGWRNLYCGVFSLKQDDVTYYFIDNEYYFKRDTLYGEFDDAERFAFFSKAVLDMMGYLDYYPTIMHANDWQTALSVIYLKTLYYGKFGFSEIKSVFTIHNIEYQGKYGHDLAWTLFGLPEYTYATLDYDGCLNLLKGAIEYSNYVTTVSPTYAQEIRNAFFAHKLEYCINKNSYKISGVLNGIDEVLYNSEKDNKLFAHYSVNDLSGKKVCKKKLQEMLSLPQRDVPIIAIISRLVSHKGLDLVKCVLEEILSEDVQVIILGKGDWQFENYFGDVAYRYGGKCRMIPAYNKDLASKIYSGADIFLMPSKQEPCGLSQMIACRYGTVPVVRRTGGLADSITPFNEGNRDKGIGFVFNNYNAHEMLYVIKDAIFTYGNKEVWTGIMKRAMQTDFSWKNSAVKYEEIYEKL